MNDSLHSNCYAQSTERRFCASYATGESRTAKSQFAFQRQMIGG
jgi:hypothetical protein